MNHQSNTQFGDIQLLAAEDLTGKAGYLVTVDSDGQAALPAAVTDLALYLVLEGAAAGAPVGLRPLAHGQQARVELQGTITAGTRVRLATPDGTADGKALALGSTAGTYFSPGVALEAGSDGQLLLIQPDPRLVTVASAAIADPTGGTTTDAEARTAIASLIAALETAGLIATE